MIKQRENDWNKRYIDKDIPWEEDTPSIHLKETLDRYALNKKTLLEIGCGLGINAIWFSELGYNVEATDISSECIDLAKKRLSVDNKRIVFSQLDFINEEPNKKYDIIFDKGCLHSFTTQESYNFFAAKVVKFLKDDGLWINISGNADNPDDLTKRKELHFPRLTLRNIVQAVEPHFEILEVSQQVFGNRNSFRSWVGVFKKRTYFYE